MKASKEELLKFLRNWRTAGELRGAFGLEKPEAYMAELAADGYDIKMEMRELGQFRVASYRWTGIKN
ncbi:MAG: hypothetical protein K2O66_03780 [Bacteroidales bacterium]|nr:hypothetical protein [Bacteroidales bacterium]MDE7072470.1 hypothetical protein [Bacteroidales bacterium]